MGISLVEVYERVGKTVISVDKKAQKGLTDALHGCEKSLSFVIYSYFKDSAGTAVKGYGVGPRREFPRTKLCPEAPELQFLLHS